MKIRNIIILYLIILFTICGCQEKKKNYSNPNNNGKNNLTNELKIVKTSKIICDELKESDNINYISYNFFTTKQGELYSLNIDKLFSNEQNCKKIESDVNIVRPFGANLSFSTGVPVMLGADNNLYEVHNDYKLYSYSADDVSFPQKTDRSDLFFTSYGYFHYLDNKIINFKCNCNPFNIFDNVSKIENLKLEEEEKIINFSGNSVITSNSIYYLDKINTNQDRCNKYADIECEYKVVWKKVDETINRLRNNILYFDKLTDVYVIIYKDLMVQYVYAY